MVEYILIVCLLAFTVNFLLLLGINRLTGGPPGGCRTLIAAAFAAVHIGLSVIPEFRFLSDWGWNIVFMCLIAWIAWGWSFNALRKGVMLAVMRAALGVVIQGGAFAVMLSAIMVFTLCMFDRSPQHHYVPVVITHGNKKVCLTAFLDTGNTLSDPITGSPVLVVDGKIASTLLSLELPQLLDPISTLQSCCVPGLRLIPYSAIGTSFGFLLGMKMDQLYIDGKPSKAIVAFAPQPIGQGKHFRALMGGNS